ncbi:transposase [Candidatus Pacearchaeota archaeon]|nr:transposase [Candidatus Pacearchaeota archaeon]
METQLTFSGSSVGANKKHIQLTPKYRYHMMQKEKINIFCKISIEEACKRHKIEIIILKVLPNHVHLIVNLTLC